MPLTDDMVVLSGGPIRWVCPERSDCITSVGVFRQEVEVVTCVVLFSTCSAV